jgi:hypothetical protein
MQSIAVFCGSSDHVPAQYIRLAEETGRTLAQRGYQLVYGAGKTGLMGAVADGALAAGGTVIGVITKQMNTPALVHTGLSRLEVTPDMLSRKARMIDLADSFIVLPGGYGTLDELFEVAVGLQLGIHQKPVGLLDSAGFYQPLLAALRHMSQAGFIPSAHLALLQVDDEIHPLLAKMEAFQAPRDSIRAWLREDQA